MPAMTVHRLEPDRRTLHGHVSRDLEPVLEVDPGDRVELSTLDAGWHLEPPGPDGTPVRRFEPRDPELDRGHALVGPILVRGARPGAVLEVRIEALEVGAFGWNFAGGWASPLNERLGLTERRAWLSWTLDAARGVAVDDRGRRAPLRPFLGWMGNATAEPGRHSTTPPRRAGGNIDCRALVAGSALFLPVEVDGALFSCGDGHAAQGDGEVSGIAIECPMRRVSIAFELHDGPLAWPRARTKEGLVTLGFDRDLNEAAAVALDGMLSWLHELHGVGREEAMALASVAVDLRVTQVVNDVWGVHAVLPDAALDWGGAG
jgi:acetamidase/formamidase